MSFAYTTGLPNPPDNPSNDVSGMQQNTNTISSWVDVDHIGFNNSAGGTHVKVTINNPVTTPSVSSTTGIVTTQTANSKSELFYTNATANAQITNTSLTVASGEGMFPGGLQVRCGTGNANNPTGSVNTFSTAFPTACISVVICANNTGTQVNVSAISSTNFTAKAASAGTFGIYYIAVGY